MSDVNSQAAWVCAIWCGVATRLIRERKAKEPPMTKKSIAQVRSAIEASLHGHPYLEEPAREALAALDRPGPHDAEKCPELSHKHGNRAWIHIVAPDNVDNCFPTVVAKCGRVVKLTMTTKGRNTHDDDATCPDCAPFRPEELT